MVAIVDDREDVWGRCPNLVHVKPYIFFAGTADINAPPPPPTPTTPSPTTPGGPHFFRPKFPPQHVPFKTRLLSKGANEKELPRINQPEVEVKKKSDKNFNTPQHPDPTALVKDNSARVEVSERSSTVQCHVGSKNDSHATRTGGEGHRNEEGEGGVGEEGQGGGEKGGGQEEGKDGEVKERGEEEGDREKKVGEKGGEEERGKEGGERGEGTDEAERGKGEGREGKREERAREEKEGREGGENQSGKKMVKDKVNDSSSSSSSSDSDSEDSSTSSSSEIDDSLFEHLGEEEQDEKGKEEKIIHLEMVAMKSNTG